ncbi:peroxisomal sarcosine oxidase-like [Physella acuta]|uniref:peroxisomal sarcosine oxidase-like n=1 Tax=Physella acuta TaxID=109671 RepID=UPI0027DE696C|nr:peroxisomal sarcosine oxidase-like [Physella acuta]
MASLRALYDVIVIGAGIEGSSSAYNLVKSGKRVLLLEQFPLPHSRGSSHGQSRITRYAYEEDFYVRMMVDAFPMWAELERESGVDFFVNCGTLDMRQPGSRGLQEVANSLRAHNVPHEVLTPADVRRRFPVINGGDNCGGIWDPSGGILRADRALRAFQTVFKDHGGVIRDGEKVCSITPGGATVTVMTSRSVYTASSVVIAAGAWAGPLCASLGLHLPLQPIRANVYYWKAESGAGPDYASSRFPCIIDSRKHSGYDVYSLPMDEYPGLVKVCYYTGPEIDPDERDKVGSDEWVVDRVRDTLTSTFPTLEREPAIREYCIFTKTPDLHPFIDRHPRHPNIIIAVGFSGHGFKLAPAVGKAVCELVFNLPPPTT